MCWQECMGLVASVVAAIATTGTAVIVIWGFMRGWQSPKRAFKMAQKCHNVTGQVEVAHSWSGSDGPHHIVIPLGGTGRDSPYANGPKAARPLA